MTKTAETALRDEYAAGVDGTEEEAAAVCSGCGERIFEGDRAVGILTDRGDQICVCAGCASGMSLRDTLELLGVYFITGEVRGVSLHLDKMRASARRFFA
jgi:hypothetical protein